MSQDNLLSEAKKVAPDAVDGVDREQIKTSGGIGDDMMIQYYGENIKTVDELIASASIDMKLWDIVNVVVNSWGVAGKLRQGQNESGRWLSEKLWQQSLKQIKVTLRRKAPKFIQSAIKELIENWKPRLDKPKRKVRPTNGEEHMLELALHDAHFGKRCWEAQTGANFDLEIIRKDYCDAIDKLFDRAGPYSIEKVLIPIGSDFFQVNNWTGTTVRGTQVDSVDDRMTKVFLVGRECIEYAINRALEVADVQCFYLGGNHDKETSWYLAQTFEYAYRDNQRVTVDIAPCKRKYFSYGPSLLGFTHGDEIKIDRLPNLMALESPDFYSAKYRHWHLGHLHKKGQTRFTVGDSINGVEVWYLPSLSGTDAWHFDQGFVGNVRAAEAYLWGKTSGYVGHLSVSV